MTATDRVNLVFLLPHVFGHRALDLPIDLRQPFLTMISYAQIIMISVRGRRSYNKRELHEIFERGWIIFFDAMESICSRNHDVKYLGRLKRHRKNPKKNKMPKHFARAPRYALPTFEHGTRISVVRHSSHVTISYRSSRRFDSYYVTIV